MVKGPAHKAVRGKSLAGDLVREVPTPKDAPPPLRQDGPTGVRLRNPGRGG